MKRAKPFLKDTMPRQRRSQRKLLLHSEAKVRLLGTYLRNYLSVITNTQYTRRIIIFDMFCGPGIYENGGEGSPLVILREVNGIYLHRRQRNLPVPTIDCYFSDAEIDNTESLCSAIKELNLENPHVGIQNIECKDYKEKLGEVLSQFSSDSSTKRFIFIDPYGYRDVRATEIKQLLDRRAEVLLFLPIQFMYRFETQGTPDALRQFIADLDAYSEWAPTNNAGEFVLQLRDAFRSFLGHSIYVSTFSIEKDPQTLFALFFFTTHLLGHEKMIDAKWAVDDNAGKGWSFRIVPGQSRLIRGIETFQLEHDLFEYLKGGNKNNCDVYEFAVIKHEYRSTHATKVCQKLVAEDRLKVHNISNSPIKRGASYINYNHYANSQRKVVFEVT